MIRLLCFVLAVLAASIKSKIDRIYGDIVTRRLRAMGIRDKPIASASPWQNGFAERLIGSVRRECLDQCARSSWRDSAGESPAQARP